MQHNQHAISNDLTGDMIGNMITPEGSLFNHSCRPNVSWSIAPGGRLRSAVAASRNCAVRARIGRHTESRPL